MKLLKMIPTKLKKRQLLIAATVFLYAKDTMIKR